MKKKNKLLVWLIIVVVLMFFFGYGLVPLYDVMCKVLGINGKTENAKVVNTSHVDKTRKIDMQFLTTGNADIPWTFRPIKKAITVYPGENVHFAYYAKNNSKKTMTIQAIPSVTPFQAAAYLKKTECFCFNRQTLKAGESVEMPVVFHLTNALPKNIHEVTLSYTIFEIKDKHRK